MKARITYSPENQEPQSWEFDPDTIDNLDAEVLEIVGGDFWDSYGRWFELLGRGNIRAIRALLWILQRRTNPDLDFNEIRFSVNQVSLEELDGKPEGKDEPGESDTDSPSPQPA